MGKTAVNDFIDTAIPQGKKKQRGCRLSPESPLIPSVPAARSQSFVPAAVSGFLGLRLVFLGHILAFARGGVLLLALFGAHGTFFFSASATACGFLYVTGAPGVRFGASASARGVRAGETDAAGADQPGHAKSGEQFLQILAVHSFLLVRVVMPKVLIDANYLSKPIHW
jgi:hypothetical protein